MRIIEFRRKSRSIYFFLNELTGTESRGMLMVRYVTFKAYVLRD